MNPALPRLAPPLLLTRFVAAFAVLAAFFLSACGPNLGTTFKVSDKETVRYSGKSTEDEAKRVADVLREVGYFNNSMTKDVLLKKEDATGTTVSFVVGDNWNTPEILEAFKQIGRAIADKLGVKSLNLRFVDPQIKVLKELPIGS